jgi:hypothetical protein
VCDSGGISSASSVGAQIPPLLPPPAEVRSAAPDNDARWRIRREQARGRRRGRQRRGWRRGGRASHGGEAGGASGSRSAMAMAGAVVPSATWPMEVPAEKAARARPSRVAAGMPAGAPPQTRSPISGGGGPSSSSTVGASTAWWIERPRGWRRHGRFSWRRRTGSCARACIHGGGAGEPRGVELNADGRDHTRVAPARWRPRRCALAWWRRRRHGDGSLLPLLSHGRTGGWLSAPPWHGRGRPPTAPGMALSRANATSQVASPSPGAGGKTGKATWRSLSRPYPGPQCGQS